MNNNFKKEKQMNLSKQDYEELSAEYSELEEKRIQLTISIHKATDPTAIALLRADYRELTQQREVVYNRIIELKPWLLKTIF